MLNTQNKGLSKRNNNAQEVATKTLITGTITTVDGILNITTGTPMLASVNPTTVATGTKLVHDGTKEIVAGSAAIAVGGVGIGVSSSVNDNIRDFSDVIKSSTQTNKAQAKQVKETTTSLKAMGIINVDDSSDSDNDSSKQTVKNTPVAGEKNSSTLKKDQAQENEEESFAPEKNTQDETPELQAVVPDSEKGKPAVQSKVVKSEQSEEKELSDAEVISIIKDVYTDAEIDAKISDDSDEDSNIVAASASINAGSNIVKSTNTDDKLSRKLSRFNNDSIIESRKKMKKVQAVSASSGKKA